MRNTVIPTVEVPSNFRQYPISPYTDKAELDITTTLAMGFECPRVLEIGTNQGITTTRIAEVVGPLGGQVWTVDVGEHPMEMPHQQVGECYPEGGSGSAIPEGFIDDEWVCHFTFNPNTENIGSVLLALDPSPFHIIFLDGDHGYVGTRSAWEATQGHLAAGGVMLFHDVWWDRMDFPQGPSEVLEEIAQQSEDYATTINMTHMGTLGRYVDNIRGEKT